MIQIRSLRKTFGALEAVHGLSLDIPRGELFCFLGPNGAGKTTTIKMLTGLMRPTSGQAMIGEWDITRQPLQAKKIMGYIPDTPFLYEQLTPPEFMEFTADIFELTGPDLRQESRQLMETFGLGAYSTALIRDLSHGMRQRLIYAATFLHRPEVLFIDEPLIGLDPYTIRMIKDLLVAKTREGMTILLTTHILALAQDIANRIGIIHKGNLVALGTLDELRRTFGPRHTLEDIFLSITGSSCGDDHARTQDAP